MSKLPGTIIPSARKPTPLILLFVGFDEFREGTHNHHHHSLIGIANFPIFKSSPPSLNIDLTLNEFFSFFFVCSKVPAFLNVVDIAGLVKGASEGQGLGNAFLSHISACDAIFHLVRAFEDDDVTHIEGDVNPVRDLEIIGEELRLKDEEMLMKNLEKLERTVLRGGDKKMKPEYVSCFIHKKCVSVCGLVG